MFTPSSSLSLLFGEVLPTRRPTHPSPLKAMCSQRTSSPRLLDAQIVEEERSQRTDKETHRTNIGHRQICAWEAVSHIPTKPDQIVNKNWLIVLQKEEGREGFVVLSSSSKQRTRTKCIANKMNESCADKHNCCIVRPQCGHSCEACSQHYKKMNPKRTLNILSQQIFARKRERKVRFLPAPAHGPKFSRRL